jgi:hypothetical protein
VGGEIVLDSLVALGEGKAADVNRGVRVDA